MNTLNKETQAMITPEKGLQLLKEGNIRFQNNVKSNRNLIEQVRETSKGQYPFATILGCIDSRAPSELIFDQGIGDIFNIRIAGNIINEDILGSMEFACKLAGTKLIIVLGHTNCGAIKGACDYAELGNLTSLLKKIYPAIKAVSTPINERVRNSSNTKFIDDVSAKNVKLSIDLILKESDVIAQMNKNKEVMIVGAMYNIENGEVKFFD